MAGVRGGDRLAQVLERIGVATRRARRVKVGFLERATYPDGKQVAMIAAINEFGAPGASIPPRPFFRNMIAAKSGEWPRAISGLLVANEYDAERTLGQVGEAVAGQLRQSIIDTNEPPNAPSTIRRKGHAKPLVDTGHMLQSVSYEIVGDD